MAWSSSHRRPFGHLIWEAFTMAFCQVWLFRKEFYITAASPQERWKGVYISVGRGNVKIWLGLKEVKSFCELGIRLFTYVVASGRTNLISHGRSCRRDWVLDADFEVLMFWIFITKLFKTCIWLLSCQKYWTEVTEMDNNPQQANSTGLEFLERFWSQELDVGLPMIRYMKG